MITQEQIRLVEGLAASKAHAQEQAFRDEAAALRALLQEREELRRNWLLSVDCTQKAADEQRRAEAAEAKLSEAQREIERRRDCDCGTGWTRARTAEARIHELEAQLQAKDQAGADSWALIVSHEGHIEKLEAQLQSLQTEHGNRVQDHVSERHELARRLAACEAQLADEQAQHRLGIANLRDELQAERKAHASTIVDYDELCDRMKRAVSLLTHVEDTGDWAAVKLARAALLAETDKEGSE